MTCFHCSFAATLTALLLAAPTRGQEPIQLGRTPDISPDGRLVAFSYLGDIWTVETIGGIARPVTMHVSYDLSPVFSPDGRSLAFVSDRHGGYDIYVVSVHGGRPRRLTFDSATDVVNGWSADGKNILFSSRRSTEFPPSYELYTVPAEGGRVRRVSVAEGRKGAFSPDGKQIAYVRGPGTWYRKGYRGSSNDELWVCNTNGTNNRRLTQFLGQDNSPMWSPDGRSLYYVSDHFGTPANVVRLDLANGSKIEPVTEHQTDGVRRARISRDGEWIVYECGADLRVVSTSSRQSRALAIEVHADDKTNTERISTFTQGATEFALAPDEKHFVFVVHGELFRIPISGGKATRMTDNPAYDHGVTWTPDGKKIVFASDRGGHEDLYLLEPDDPEHPELVDAHRFKVKQLTNTPEAEFGVRFSPDGKLISFLRSGQLWTMKPDGSDPKILIKETRVFDYEWSPDGKWIVFARIDGSFASEMYIIPSGGGEARNVSRYATYNGDVTWSNKNYKLAYISQRRQNYKVCVQSLQKPAVSGAPASSAIDWEDIHLRVNELASIEGEACSISPDGSKVAIQSTGSSHGDDLWVVNSDGRSLTRLTTGNLRPQQMQWSKRLSDLIYFRDRYGRIRMTKIGFTKDPSTISFSARMVISRDEEYAEMFEQSWRALSDHFYDTDFHGVDWEAVRAKYRPLVKHVTMKEDLYALISMMMGELNASHLGISGAGSFPQESTADLGLLFDEGYTGPGVKIAEIIKRGPTDKRGLDLKPGEVIYSIDGVELTDSVNLSEVLNDKSGETVVVRVAPVGTTDPKKQRRLELKPGSRGQVQGLMYERWVADNAQRVSDMSGGNLGYIHIPSMNEAGLDRFVRSLYSDNFDKEAIVLDVRYNGGGFTHDQVLDYLGAKEHTLFRQRDGGEGLVLRSYDRKWTKPLVLLINNRSYSDAEIFPSAFRKLGLGKLVGQPTGGHVIGTSSIRLIDGSSFRIPRTGVFTVDGVNMEKEGVKPDVLVEQHPDDLAKGIDRQLEKAVEVLKGDVAVWKKSRTGVASKPEEPKSGSSTPEPKTPMPGSK